MASLFRVATQSALLNFTGSSALQMQEGGSNLEEPRWRLLRRTQFSFLHVREATIDRVASDLQLGERQTVILAQQLDLRFSSRERDAAEKLGFNYIGPTKTEKENRFSERSALPVSKRSASPIE